MIRYPALPAGASDHASPAQKVDVLHKKLPLMGLYVQSPHGV
jgi:hypothetical protein